MEVDVIDRQKDFLNLRSNWEFVYAADPDAQFFLSWTWLYPVLGNIKKGWRILAVKNVDQKYVAFFPLRMSVYLSKRNQIFCNDIQMAGRSAWADYTGFICLPEFEKEAIAGLCAKLLQMNWAQMDLKNLLMSPPRLHLFLSHFKPETFSIHEKARGKNSAGVDNDICPHVVLPDDFETFLREKLSRNQRGKMRRFLRRVDKGEELRITETQPATYERDVTTLIGLWKEMWKEKKGKRIHHLARKFQSILLQSLQRGMLYLPMLWNEDTPIAALGSYVDQQKKAMYFKISGRDQSRNKIPSGLILHGHSIRWAIENGIRWYDFMRGDESYKYSYGSSDRRIRNYWVVTQTYQNLHGKLDKESLGEVFKRANEHQKSGRYKVAENGYEQVLEGIATNPSLLGYYGQRLYRTEQFTMAGKFFRRLAEVDSENVFAWQLLGDANLAIRAFPGAESAFRNAIQLEPSPRAHFCLGCALQLQGKHQEARNELKNVLRFEVTDSKGINLQAKAAKLLNSLE